MIFEVINKLRGLTALLIFKLLYRNKINYDSLPFFGSYLSLSLRGNSNLKLGSKIKGRKRIDFFLEDGEIIIGDNVFINNDCSLNSRSSIKIGHNCLLGENVKIYDHNHKHDHLTGVKHSEFSKKPIIIGNNCWLGANSVILQGVEIGDGAIIGAGVVVYKNIPAQSVVVPSPPQHLK